MRSQNSDRQKEVTFVERIKIGQVCFKDHQKMGDFTMEKAIDVGILNGVPDTDTSLTVRR